MTILLLFSLLGAGFLILLYALIARGSSSAPEGSAQSLVSAHSALSRLQDSLLAERVVDRIFSDSDFMYVASIGSPEVIRLFLSERRRVALLWVAQIRSQIHKLMRFHRSQSGFYANLSLSAEMSLVGGFWSLLLMCHALQLLIYFRGPYEARTVARRAVAAAGHVCDLTGKPISFPGAYSAGMTRASYTGSESGK